MCSSSSLLFVSINGSERGRKTGILRRQLDKGVLNCNFISAMIQFRAAKWKRAASLLRLKATAIHPEGGYCSCWRKQCAGSYWQLDAQPACVHETLVKISFVGEQVYCIFLHMWKSVVSWCYVCAVTDSCFCVQMPFHMPDFCPPLFRSFFIS